MKKRIISFFIMSCLLTSVITTTSAIEDSEVKTGGQLLQEAIEQDEVAISESINQAYIEISDNEKQALNDSRKIKNKVMNKENNGDIDYVDYFAGTYIDNNDKLVLQVTKDASETEIAKITDGLDISTDVQVVDFSYEDIQNVYNEYSTLMTEISAKVNNGTATETEKMLNENVQSIELSQNKNANVVVLKELSDETKKEFLNYFGNENVIFKESDKEDNKIETTTLKPGLTIGVVVSQNEGITTYKTGSLGARVTYTRADGTEVYGFLTAGHCVDELNQIVYCKVGDTYNSFGKVNRYRFSISYDVAFIRHMNTDDFTSSRYTAYSNSNGETTEKYKACQNCAYGYIDYEIVEGATVYKCGYKTFLTKGEILSTSATVNYTEEGVTLTNMISADYDSAKGDSGGLVFTIHNSTNNTYDVAGVHSGGNPTTKYFTSLNRYDTFVMDKTGSMGFYQY